MTSRTIAVVAAALACIVLACASVAAAQTPSEDTYGGLANQQQGAVSPDTNSAAGTTQTASSGTLPFTGFELGIALVAGVALVGTGLVLRRASRGSEA
jgi:hypothetical protein